jgi:hypothetical protein
MIKRLIIQFLLKEGFDFIVDVIIQYLNKNGVKDWEKVTINLLNALKEADKRITIGDSYDKN